ncbi:MAG: 16S rRNA (adenine(1518)-N(6)/adenine(1519)-N(6))-dimethyltransferase RsmA [Clostridia bacterium]|nr:16S rRNA (adenine(1518)-N(6)/adenine(1519)-N(6))-dimethyltransferase RsmA [Clostridia bacterium]
MDLTSPSTIKEIRDRHNFQLSKSLGQNFITDRNVLDQIISGAGVSEGDLVIEIGPGIGVLTAEAAEIAARVIAIEIDRNLIPILKETLSSYDNVEVINQDVLKTDITEIINRAKADKLFTGKVRVIGNLPYYITTPIIMKLLEEGVPVDSITVMMQKEVADRIRSGPGNKAYGAISVAVQYYCDVERVANVPKEVFVPRPKVDSTVLNLLPLSAEGSGHEETGGRRVELADEKAFFNCVKAAFAQRRKTLLNSLSSAGGMDKEKVKLLLGRAGIDPGRRAETLTIEEFGRLANEMAGGR